MKQNRLTKKEKCKIKELAVDLLVLRIKKKLVCINGKRKIQIKEANHTEPMTPF